MCIYVCMFVCMYAYDCSHIFLFIAIQNLVYIRMHVCMYACMYAYDCSQFFFRCNSGSVHVCMYVCMCIPLDTLCLCVCVYVRTSIVFLCMCVCICTSIAYLQSTFSDSNTPYINRSIHTYIYTSINLCIHT